MSLPERDENGDVVEDRTTHTFTFYDSVYGGLGGRPSIELTVRCNPDRQPSAFVIHELTRAYLTACRSLFDEGMPHE